MNQVNLEKDQKLLKIHDLAKTFANGMQAVRGINVRMYEGMCACIHSVVCCFNRA